MFKYIAGILTGIGFMILAAVLLAPKPEDLNNMWRWMADDA